MTRADRKKSATERLVLTSARRGSLESVEAAISLGGIVIGPWYRSALDQIVRPVVCARRIVLCAARLPRRSTSITVNFVAGSRARAKSAAATAMVVSAPRRSGSRMEMSARLMWGVYGGCGRP